MCAYAEELRESTPWLTSSYVSNVKGAMIEKVV